MRSSTTRSNGSSQPGLDTRDAVADRRHLVAVSFEEIDDALSEVCFIFDEQDTHASTLCHAQCKAYVRADFTKA